MKPYFETKLGKLYCGSSLEILPDLRSEKTLCLTDPPYGVTQNKWDDIETTKEVFDFLRQFNIVFTCQNPSTAVLINRYLHKFKWCDVWHKSQAVGFLNAKVMPLRQHEDIIVLSCGKMPYIPQITKKHPADVRPHGKTAQSDNYGKFNNERKRTIKISETYPRSVIYYENSQKGLHPNEKPVGLFRYLIETHTSINDVVFDPFLGSGTTATACEELKRKWIGIEISEKYCEIAAKRIEKENQQLRLF